MIYKVNWFYGKLDEFVGEQQKCDLELIRRVGTLKLDECKKPPGPVETMAIFTQCAYRHATLDTRRNEMATITS